MIVKHPFDPLFDRDSKILILGSFPSVKSREQRFYYGHPQNRFWKTISAIFEEETPLTIELKKEMLKRNHIALWDSIAYCDIKGSSDASICNVTANDISKVLNGSSIKRIYCNGNTSYKIYEKYVFPKIGIHAVCLPSTSPANAACTLDKLIEKWSVVKD